MEKCAEENQDRQGMPEPNFYSTETQNFNT